MLSVVVEKPGHLSVAERAVEEPAPGELRVRVQHAGICGSDLHIYHGLNPFAVYPRVVGHEFVGYVDAVGEGVDAGRIGELVAVDPVVACGKCYPCSVGRPNVCSHLQVIGVHRDGGFSQYAFAPADNAWKIPDGVEEHLATMVEPYAVAANVTNRTGVFSNDVALVYGAGPTGLTVIDVLKGVYNVPVIVVDRIDERLEKARKVGADHALNTTDESLPVLLERLGLVPTLIVDAVCHPSILEEAVRIASPAARIGLLGFSTQPSAIAQQELTKRELTLFASRLNCRMFPRVIDWMAQGLIRPERLITHRFDFRDVANAIGLIERSPDQTSKVLLDFN